MAGIVALGTRNVWIKPATRQLELVRSHQLAITSSVVRPANLATAIAQAIRAGRRVVLLDASFEAPSMRGGKKTLREEVREQGVDPALLEGPASRVINLDHHNPEQGAKTATELVFEKLEDLRSLDEPIEVFINHGDTDAFVSLYVARNLDRTFSEAEKELLIGAARAGDHGVIKVAGQERPVDYKESLDSFPDALRLDLALTGIAFEHNLFLWKIWNEGIAPEETIRRGIEKAHDLIGRAMQSPASVLRQPDSVALIEKTPVRASIRAIDSQVEGITIDTTISDHPIAIVDATKPGLGDFDTLAAFSSHTNPTMILIVRDGRVVGVGRNNACADWLQLRAGGFYDSFNGRLHGGDHAGGSAVARDAFNTLPTPEEALATAQQFIRDALAKKG